MLLKLDVQRSVADAWLSAWNSWAQPWLGGHKSLENVQKRLLGNVLPRAFFNFFFAFIFWTEVLPRV